jgi:hypothetical protein
MLTLQCRPGEDGGRGPSLATASASSLSLHCAVRVQEAGHAPGWYRAVRPQRQRVVVCASSRRDASLLLRTPAVSEPTDSGYGPTPTMRSTQNSGAKTQALESMPRLLVW